METLLRHTAGTLPVPDAGELTDARGLRLGEASRAMLRLTLLTAALSAVMIAARGLTFPAFDAVEPLAIGAGLLALAAFYRFVRPAPNFVLALKALAALVVFSSVYSVFMYALATTGRPLADAILARIDGALGFSAPAVVGWVNERPRLALFMWLVYFSLIPQTILAIVWLGLRNEQARLDTLLVRFMLGGLITALGFCLWPAMGTYGAAYNLPVPSYCRLCADHLEALRDGSRLLVSWRGAEGLITFPSFHTIWAVLLISAFAGSKYLVWPMAVLNVLVVVSTITTGGHYFTDVLAGLAISAIVIVGTRRLLRRVTGGGRNKKGPLMRQ